MMFAEDYNEVLLKFAQITISIYWMGVYHPVYLTDSGRCTAVSQRALKYIYFHSRGPDDRAGRPAR